ncbi:hypothetical protein HPP92_023746 [Vanilla planifolia]|uniref:N-acetyltransferase domain-containing protein n=1 Tax=Vanilla planifolia TaxID=51239 RepID=A0A835UD55_VANPL|nr:hypothetical protein HPP92_023746 [Vanilla planifolia]
MLLERGDELITVAAFRVYGEKIAEMPLVGTRAKYRRQGMCRLLVNELEMLLVSLGVERLLLPAVPQLLETWTTKFGFAILNNADRLSLLNYTFLNFQDTTMCQKRLGEAPSIQSKPEDGSNGSVEDIDSGNVALPCFNSMASPVHTEAGPVLTEAGIYNQTSPSTSSKLHLNTVNCHDLAQPSVQNEMDQNTSGLLYTGQKELLTSHSRKAIVMAFRSEKANLCCIMHEYHQHCKQNGK